MRTLLLLVALTTIATPAWSQDDVVEDTLDWRGYYPLEVGNAWEVETWIFVAYTSLARREIVEETVIDGRSYFVEVSQGSTSDEEYGVYRLRSDTLYLRYDTLGARVVALSEPGGEEWDHTCDLSADFGTEIVCERGRFVDGYYARDGASLQVGEDTIHYAAVKNIYNLGGGDSYFHGVGMLPGLGDATTGTVEFTYLRIGGKEYGERALFPPYPLTPEENGFNWTAAIFTWRSSPGAGAYQFQISRDSTAFVDLAVDTVVVDTAFADDIFEPDGWYHWRVRAIDVSESDTSRWSPPRRFYLNFPVGVEDDVEVPEELVVRAPYPDPARSSVSLDFELGEPGDVRIEIVDLLGRLITSYELGWRGRGAHTFTLRDLPSSSGLYFARLRSGAHHEVVGFSVVR